MNNTSIFLVLTALLVTGLFLFKQAFEENHRHRAMMINLGNGFIMLLMIIFLLIKLPLLMIIIAIYLVMIFQHGYKTYEDVKLKKINLTSLKVKEEIKVAFIADFQFDVKDGMYNNNNMKTATEMLSKLDYDYLLLGGDYINYPCTIPSFKEDLEK